jgi:DnaJ-class molecular chaperone
MHKCPQCSGSGIYGILITDVINGADSIIDKCDMCGGTGEMDVIDYMQVMEPPKDTTPNLDDLPF